MKHSLFIATAMLLPLVAPFSGKAQVNTEGHWGKPYLNVIYSAAAANDGGYILTGLTKNGINDDYGDILVIKVDSHADTQWTFTYGGPYLEGGNCVIQTADGGYMVSGHTQDFGSVDCDAFLLKLDNAGNRLWLKHIGSYADDIAEGTIELPGGGYIFAGITESYGNADTSSRARHMYVVKTNSAGDSLWTKYYAGTGTEYGYSIAIAPSGGYLAVGWTTSYGAGEKDGWLLRLNDVGDTVWTRRYRSGTGDTRFFKIIPAIGGGFIMTGIYNQLDAKNSMGVVVKLDANGVELWRKTYSAVGDGIGLHDVAQLPNGNLMFGGYSFETDTTGVVYILTTDSNGVKIADEYCGGNTSYANAIALHSNTSYLVAGATNKYGNTYGDVYWRETETLLNGVATITGAVAKLYPNPVSGFAAIELPTNELSQTATLELTNSSGQMVYKTGSIPVKDLSINSKSMANGLYLYKITCADGKIHQGKFVVNHTN